MIESDKMFSFFHRTSKITLDCFTTEENIYNFTPIVKASKTIPDWWKKLPNYEFILKRDEKEIFVNDSIQNLKNCYGFLELFKNSITIRHWTDLYLEVDENDFSWFVMYGQSIETHSREQIGEGFKNYHHLKLSSPWVFREKEGIKFSWFGAEWNLDNYDFVILPGVVNFYINAHTNINMMIPKQKREYLIPAGLPLVNLIPLTEKKLILKNHLVTIEEFRKYQYSPSARYFHGWRTAEKLFEKHDKKCPFGFGE